ncbi:MAG: prepilin-type N-terminal cleavage/methylation domain-containing protein [Elusimicrobiaceae bacterium]|nr:prepilin-type N-terminal cleavage/methylation domain-containing protein [Elusimicrobiaceae bacterium]
MNTNKGFTLIELLVVVLIIGILAAMALPQYFKAVERSRMSEAVTLLGNIAQAEQRKYLQINRYTAAFTALDVAPKGATGSVFYTKGNPTNGTNGNGFRIELSGTDYTSGKATATRASSNGTLQYKYSLTRFYASNDTTCTGADDNGDALCADFCGVDAVASHKCCSTGVTGDCPGPVSND